MPEDAKKIAVVSDSTGRTAKRLMDAVLAQYNNHDITFYEPKIYRQVRDRATVERIVGEMDEDTLVIFSIVSTELSEYFHDLLKERGILNLNVLEPMLSTMSKFLGVHPDYQPGILHVIDDKYYQKVDAIGYTVEHDDGLGQSIWDADVVLLGPSRTCKTPISMYLACNYGLKVANIPVVADEALEPGLLTRLEVVQNHKIIGLTMRPEVLTHVREERSHYLTHAARSVADVTQYFDIKEVRAEVRFCLALFNRHGWEVVDVTRRAIEEISRELLEKLGYPH